MSRRELPTPEMMSAFADRWERYLSRTVLRAWQEDSPAARRRAVFAVVERVLRLRKWERRCAVTLLAARAVNSMLIQQIEERAERHGQDMSERAMEIATREAERLHRSRQEGETCGR